MRSPRHYLKATLYLSLGISAFFGFGKLIFLLMDFNPLIVPIALAVVFILTFVNLIAQVIATSERNKP